MPDNISRFVALRGMLEAERSAIYQRLRELDAALGAAAGTQEQPKAASPSPAPLVPRRRGRPPGSRNTSSAGAKFGLREAIAQAVARGPLLLRDLVPAVQKLGYRFTSKNPYNSMGAYLYSPRGQVAFRKTANGFVAK